MKWYTFIARYFRDFFDGKNHACLVVRPHHRNERRVRADGISQCAQTQPARFIDVDNRDFVTASREFLRRFAHRAVFDCGSYDVLALRSGFERGMKSRVVRFCAATGEHDLARLTTEESGDLLARLLDGVAHLSGEPVAARWIGEIF